MSERVLALLFLVGLLQVLPAAGEIYRWVDQQGRVHFSDAQPAETPADAVTLRINSFPGVAVETLIANPTDKKNSREVILYSTEWCVYCNQARRYFRKNRIPFKEYDIEKSAKARRDYDRLGGRGVPLILVGSSRMSGFSETGFDRLYANAGGIQPSSR